MEKSRSLEGLSLGSIEPGWLQGGILYAMYNLAIAPVLLFSTRAIQTRREAVLAGIITGVAVMVPAVLFHISYAAGYPEVLEQPVPNYWMMSEYATPLLLIVFSGGTVGYSGGDRCWVGTRAYRAYRDGGESGCQMIL